MKLLIVLTTLVVYLLTFGFDSSKSAAVSSRSPADGRVPKDDYLLSTDAKRSRDAPPVPFSHKNHSEKNYSIDGTRQIGCVECHHTDQPAAEAAKKPPLKTAWPADRTTTLTRTLLANNPKAPDVNSCRSCHAQKGVAPKIASSGRGVPQVTYEGDADPTELDNEEAYHRNCNTCHDAAVEARKQLKIPTSQECAKCHSGSGGSSSVSSRTTPSASANTAARPTPTPAVTRRAAIQLGVFRSREESLKKTADALIEDGRVREARQVLDLHKRDEYLNYANREYKDVTLSDRAEGLAPEELRWKKRYAQIRNRIAAIGSERRDLRAKAQRSKEEQARLEQLASDLKVAGEAFQELIEQLVNEFGGVGEAMARIFHIQESKGLMQDLSELGQGAVALYTVVGREKYRVVLITPDAVLSGEYEITAESLAAKVAAFRNVLEDPSKDPRPLARELYNIVLGPVAEQLKGARAQTLMWSLDGPLRYVPVAALHDGQKYLVETYRHAVYTPASLARLKDPAAKRWYGLGLGVSDAVGGMPPLPGVEEELRGIFRKKNEEQSRGAAMQGERILNREFTLRRLEGELERSYTVVHIASHFRLAPGDASQSFLLLGDGGRLSLADIDAAANMFGGVELLTLSACDTATPGAGAGGREVEGLGVIAQQQGARAIIASLWPVSDKSTSRLMQEFYRLLVAEPRRPKAEALRQAQLTLLSGKPAPAADNKTRAFELSADRAISQLSHPYHWAPFVLIGNWK